MNITTEWGDGQHSVIYQNYLPGWTWDDFFATNTQSVAMIGEVAHTVSIISDFRSSRTLPMGGAISQANSAMKNFPPNWGVLVVVSDSAFIRSLVGIFKRVYVGELGRKTYSATSIEEAYKIIRDKTQSTPTSS